MTINSKQKGARGEREFSSFLKDRGIAAHRTQQFCGRGGDSADVQSTVRDIHWEVKRTEALRIYKAMEQACSDCKAPKIPVVAHRQNNQDWIAIVPMDQFLRLCKLAGLIDEENPLLNLH